MAQTKTLLFGASVRHDRMDERVLLLVKERLQLQSHTVEIIDPLHVDLPFLRVPWHSYEDPEKDAPEAVRQLVAKVLEADRFIFTTCEHKRCIPPALSNLIDHLPHAAVAYKPTGIISYSVGSSGGHSVSQQVRQILSDLGCLVVPHSMAIPNVDSRISPAGQPIGETDECVTLFHEVDLVIKQVDYLCDAVHTYRSSVDFKPAPVLHPYLSE